MSARPRVAIIILSYNRRDLLARCLEEVRRNTDLQDVSVRVVDNASSDGSADEVQARFPWVDLIRLPENRGFAGGVNAGIAAGPAAAYVLLNSDAFVTPGWLDGLVEAMRVRPDAGIIGALEVASDGKPRYGIRLPQVPGPQDAEVVSFACALIRAEVVATIGLLDPGYFMYFEDWDYCRRARLAGFGVVSDARVRVWHDGQASSSRQSLAWRARVRTESRLRYQLLHGRPRRALLGAAREVALFGYWVKQGAARPYLGALWNTTKGLRGILRRRRHLTQPVRG